MKQSAKLQQWLGARSVGFITVYAALCSFGLYCCMYAFRKPFTAASFSEQAFLGVHYKVWLVTAQVLGYMLSKFYGIRFISSMKGEKRAGVLVLLIAISWAALLLFALVPTPYDIVLLLFNGFPLGIIWGLVFSYLEGRRTTEIMGAVLSVNFIFSSGIMKSIGKWMVVEWGVSEQWMPFWCGALFFLPFLLFTWLLHHMPAPSAEDVRLRTARPPMTAQERRNFLLLFLPGLVTIIITYVLLTVLRDLRDNFANELWTELGYGGQPAIFTQTEIPVSLIVLLFTGLLILVKNNLKAFLINHGIIIAGYLLTLTATVLFAQNLIGPVLWMTVVGTGLYLSYVPFNCLYFERMIAAYRIKGNVGFLMYTADAFGYLGSIAVLFCKEFTNVQLSWTQFFVQAIWIISSAGIAGTALSALYFRKKYFLMQQSISSAYVV